MINRKILLCAAISILSNACYAQDTLTAPNVEAVLYTGNNPNQSLIVGLGGSEGGNAWNSSRWNKTRAQFLENGYAFLAIGYFGGKSTPALLDRIAIEDIHAAILEATKNRKINPQKIAVVGGSRGADLALLLASYYADISCVVGMSASHAVFPGHTTELNTSCWTYAGKQLPFIPVNEESVPFLMKHNLRDGFQAMMMDTVAEQQALIPIHRIKGAILLMSASKDEIIPAVKMGNKMMSKLKKSNFQYPFEHIIYEGTHAEPTNHFDKIFEFLERNFK